MTTTETAAAAEEIFSRRLAGGKPIWQDAARAGDLPVAIERYVREYDYVTFKELMRQLEPYFPVRGEYAIDFGLNIILWAGMSKTFMDALHALYNKKRIFFHPTILLTYMADGGMLKLPLVRRLPRTPYKQPHWLPVTLRTVPFVAPKAKKGHGA